LCTAEDNRRRLVLCVLKRNTGEQARKRKEMLIKTGMKQEKEAFKGRQQKRKRGKEEGRQYRWS
jgi:hypothetical protein